MREAGNREHDTGADKVSVPVVEEQITVGSREIVTGRTLINKKVEEREEVIDLSFLSENYRVERIPINLTVENPPPVRHVGNTTIIPLLEEVAVVKKQLVLREELRITRVSTELRRPQSVRLKRETVDVLTVPPQEGNPDEFDGSGVLPMAKTVVGLFDNQQKAQAVIQELANAGFPESEIHCITRNDDTAAGNDLASGLMSAGVPSEEVRHYSNEIENGNAVLVLRMSDANVGAAVAVLERNGAKDLDQRRGSQTADFAPNDTPILTKADDGSTTTAIPVVEEELKVGKRQIKGGGVRIYTRMTEQPVEQDVSLRQERVDVERRPVNRPATEQDLREFKEGTIAVTATAEEAVVSKEAKVVEEVVVSKDISQETQAVRGTVRKTQVHVDEDAGQPMPHESSDINSGSNLTRENVHPMNDDYAYTYGRTLAADPRYRGKDWGTIEPEARRAWSTEHKGAWEEFKEKVRHAWEKMTGE